MDKNTEDRADHRQSSLPLPLGGQQGQAAPPELDDSAQRPLRGHRRSDVPDSVPQAALVSQQNSEPTGQKSAPSPSASPDSRGDLRVLAHALRQRWPVSEKMREAAVTRLAMILADSTQSPRMHVSAIRTMVELDKANALHEANDIAREAPAPSTTINVNATVDVSRLRRMSDEQLRELLESREPPDLDLGDGDGD